MEHRTLERKFPDYGFMTYSLSRFLHAYFEDFMAIIRQKSEHKSCSFMSLEYAHEFSDFTTT